MPDGSLRATAIVSEDGGRSFVNYEVILRTSERIRSVIATREGVDVLPEPEEEGWLEVDRPGKRMIVTLRERESVPRREASGGNPGQA